MKALNPYNIQFIGLKIGAHKFDYDIDNAFFHHFEYEDFNAAKLKVEVHLEKKTTLLELLFKVKGTINVNCDLTNEPYDQYIEDQLSLIVKFGESYNDINEEILIIPHGEYQINIAQYIYELVILAVPIKKVHPGIEEGTLKSDILEKLKTLSPNLNEPKTETKETDPRWDDLKKLLTDK